MNLEILRRLSMVLSMQFAIERLALMQITKEPREVKEEMTLHSKQHLNFPRNHSFTNNNKTHILIVQRSRWWWAAAGVLSRMEKKSLLIQRTSFFLQMFKHKKEKKSWVYFSGGVFYLISYWLVKASAWSRAWRWTNITRIWRRLSLEENEMFQGNSPRLSFT